MTLVNGYCCYQGGSEFPNKVEDRAFQFTNCTNSMQCSLTLDFIDLLCNEMRGNRKEINYQCIDKVMNSGVTW